MYIYLYETRSASLQGLLADLDAAQWQVVRVGDDFFDRQLDLIDGGGTDRPILLPQAPDLVSRILRLRQTGCTNPILVLRRARDPEASAAVLDAGADDDLVGPLTGVELRARVNAITRRFHGHASGSVRIGEVTAYFDGRDPDVAGQQLKLSQRELAIFQQIALAAPQIVSKASIYDAVYGMVETQPFDKVIDVYICRIRKKIEEMTHTGDPHIQTIRGRGYRLTPEVAETSAPSHLRAVSASRHEIQEAQLRQLG
ncbi:response regulator transcription factor [Pseudooceanicola aestuarii]|uniref:winged helix-turn-helix domain-containing protein n=1 Tax=Pseudooceanicola aestuarii TaxID=2697319 RepID=UPI001EF7C8D5|nr:response regulator transcription factor [Pseudooceanicola aestuarii]